MRAVLARTLRAFSTATAAMQWGSGKAEAARILRAWLAVDVALHLIFGCPFAAARV